MKKGVAHSRLNSRSESSGGAPEGKSPEVSSRSIMARKRSLPRYFPTDRDVSSKGFPIGTAELRDDCVASPWCTRFCTSGERIPTMSTPSACRSARSKGRSSAACAIRSPEKAAADVPAPPTTGAFRLVSGSRTRASRATAACGGSEDKRTVSGPNSLSAVSASSTMRTGSPFASRSRVSARTCSRGSKRLSFSARRMRPSRRLNCRLKKNRSPLRTPSSPSTEKR